MRVQVYVQGVPRSFSRRRVTRSLWPANAMKEERRQRESKESGPLEVVFNLEAPRFLFLPLDVTRRNNSEAFVTPSTIFMLPVRYIPLFVFISHNTIYHVTSFLRFFTSHHF